MKGRAIKLLTTTCISLFFLLLSESFTHAGWKMLNAETGGKTLRGVSGGSPKDVFAVGEEGIVRRYDGLRDDMQEIISGTRVNLNAVWGDSNIGVFVVGDNGTAKYLYKGSEPMNMGVPARQEQTQPHLYGVWGVSKKAVFAVGEKGMILRYDGDDDYLWKPMKNPDINASTLNAVWGTSPTNVFAVGENGTILYYDGDGDNDGTDDYLWEPMNSGTIKNLRGIWGSSSSNIFAVGENGTILYYDGDGNNDGFSDTVWEPMESGIDVHLHGIWGSSKTNIFAVGDKGIVRYYNGNTEMTWSKLQEDWPNHEKNLNGVWVSSNPHVFVIGDGGIGGYLEEKYGMSGRIIDACDGTRLSGAKVQVWQEINQVWQWVDKAVTVDKGNGPEYETIEFDNQQNTLKFSNGTGYDYEEIAVSLVYEQDINNNTYVFPLNGYQGCIAGVISELSGSYYHPISGVVVKLYKALGCEFPSTPDNSFTTDTDGHYHFSGLGAGTYKIAPIKSGYTFTPQYPALLHQSPQAYDFTPVP